MGPPACRLTLTSFPRRQFGDGVPAPQIPVRWPLNLCFCWSDNGQERVLRVQFFPFFCSLSVKKHLTRPAIPLSPFPFFLFPPPPFFLVLLQQPGIQGSPPSVPQGYFFNCIGNCPGSPPPCPFNRSPCRVGQTWCRQILSFFLPLVLPRSPGLSAPGTLSLPPHTGERVGVSFFDFEKSPSRLFLKCT